MESFSQLGEDIYVFQNFINIPRTDCVLVEVGAFDGITYSNTLMLERFSECRAILIEPSLANVRRIHENRPNASVHRLAMSSSVGVLDFAGDSAVSGSPHLMKDDYLRRWGIDRMTHYKVIGMPLKIVLQAEQVGYVDLLSVDVQGAELEVLRGFDWTTPVGTVLVELEGYDAARDQAVREVLLESGLQFVDRIHVTEVWHKPGYVRDSLLFDSSKRAPLSGFVPRHLQKGLEDEVGKHLY